MITIDNQLNTKSLEKDLQKFWELSGKKIHLLAKEYDTSKGSPVFTVGGKYTTRGWTEWTQGFQYGSEILQFDVTGEKEFLELGRQNTIKLMASHVSHFGVHDHGFNNVSTYGNLLRLLNEGKIEANEWEKHFYEIALKVSGSVQARRWTPLLNGGYIYSFNGPHSLFVDTIRTTRALVVSHILGHNYMGENDKAESLLGRAIAHAKATAQFNIWYGEGRDTYDIRGRTAHECLFNTNDGNFRAPNAQQGYSGFTTWTRGLAWAMLGFPEELECLAQIPDEDLAPFGGRTEIEAIYLKAAKATCDFYIEQTPTCGIPYWDTGAPQLHKLGDYLNRPADPYNEHEPVDSSAAAIGAQGLLRLGKYLKDRGEKAEGERYWQAGLTVTKSLLQEPYLSTEDSHQGITLHSIYHEPNGWDHKPVEGKVAYGESSMWGDYHARELALYLHRINNGEPYYTFFSTLIK